MYPSCEIRNKLSVEFSTAARVYAEAVVKLCISGIPKTDYAPLCEVTQEAQDRSQAAFTAFRKHMELHGCWGDDLTLQNVAAGRPNG